MNTAAYLSTKAEQVNNDSNWRKAMDGMPYRAAQVFRQANGANPAKFVLKARDRRQCARALAKACKLAQEIGA